MDSRDELETESDAEKLSASRSEYIKIMKSQWGRSNEEAINRVNSTVYRNEEVYRPFSIRPIVEYPCLDCLTGEPLDESLKHNRYDDVEQVLPNLRDLAVSSVQENMKTGLLYRSARPFPQDVIRLAETLIEFLGIRTILDLRDDDIEYNKREYLSRLMVLTLFQLELPRGVTKKSERCLYALRDKIDRKHKGIADGLRRRINDYSSKRRMALEQQDRLQEDSSVVVESLNKEIRSNLDALKMLNKFKDIRAQRTIVILNVLEHQHVKDRVNQQLTENLHVVPFLAMVKATDFISKKNNAAYYFSKIFISSESLLASYTEMLRTCGFRFVDLMRELMDREPPILIHCTLGKDRTGLACMLILGILGASESAIMFDYSLTAHADAHFKKFIRKFVIQDCGLTPDFCSADCIVMHGALKFLVKNYGSIEGYLRAYGLTNVEMDRIREKYLIDPSKYRPTLIN